MRVYTTRGLVEQGRFALENAKKVVDYFSEIFDLDYPLPKVDLLAVHEFVIISCSFIISVDGTEDRKLTRLFEVSRGYGELGTCYL